MGKSTESWDAPLLPLGACPRIENLLWKSWIWPYFPIIFVKYAQYSPQMIKKFDSNLLSLATAPILGQAPSSSSSLAAGSGYSLHFHLRHTG